MGRVLTVFGSLRVPVLLFALPYSMLWMGVSDSGGWLMVLAHAALVLFGFAGVDASMLRRGMEPRLVLKRGSDWFDLRVIEVSRAVLGIAALILGFALLFVQWKIGLVALVALVAMEVCADGINDRWRRRRFAWAEWTLPLAMVVAPAMLIGASAKSRAARLDVMLEEAQRKVREFETAVTPEVRDAAEARVAELAMALKQTVLMSHGVVAATVLGALAMGAYVLLCLRRDEMLDRGERLVTTPTRFGRPFAGVLLVVMLGAAIGIAAAGVSAGWWTEAGWWCAAIAAWGAVMTVWAAASNRDDTAAGVWYLAHLAMVIALTLTVIRRDLTSVPAIDAAPLQTTAVPVESVSD